MNTPDRWGAQFVVNPPAGDPYETVARAVEEATHRDGWDQPHRLYMIEPTSSGLSIRRPPVPRNLDQAHVVEMLGTLAAAVPQDGTIPPAVIRQTAGFILVHEMVGAAADRSDQERLAEIAAQANAGRLADRADHMRLRIAHLRMVDSRVHEPFSLVRLEGRDPDIQLFKGRIWDAFALFVQIWARAIAAGRNGHRP
jgi:hypothetical protein